MNLLFSQVLQESVGIQSEVFSLIFYIGMATIIGYHSFKFLEQVYARRKLKPFFVFNHLFKRKLNKNQINILEDQFDFYNKLTDEEKRNFHHRMACFIRDKKFVGREDLQITDEIKVLVSATAVMLTFGFRKYLINTLDLIIIYPSQYYSKQSQQNHKGEYNPKLRSLVLSWQDFIEGYNIGNDNLNLGIHEVAHAMHFNSLKENDISAYLFKNRFLDLTDFLQKNPEVRTKLINTKYFRAYAFTNHFEFLSVLIECFFETPKEFKAHFPKVYKYVQQMLNFNFADY